MNSKFGNLARRLRRFFRWSERPLCEHKAQTKTKNLRNRLAKFPNFEFIGVYSPNLNPIELLWKWMKERVIYNTYYEYFDNFRGAVLGFFGVLSTVAVESILGQALRSRVRDKFRAIGAPATNF